MLDEEFFVALGGVMRALRHFELTSTDIRKLVCEDVLQYLSQEQISVKLTRVEQLEICLFDISPHYSDPEEAFEKFKKMLIDRDFRVSESLLKALKKIFEFSITKFRPYNQRDRGLLRTMIIELRRL